MLAKRGCGILLHISSLPSKYGIGDLGPQAYSFVDFLKRSGQNFWQVLPLGPVKSPEYSPYNALSAFAGNPLMISPEMLIKDGLLDNREEITTINMPPGKVEYAYVHELKKRILDIAYQEFCNKKLKTGFERFCIQEHYWLDDYAVFQTIRKYHTGTVRRELPEKYRTRQPEIVEEIKKHRPEEVQQEKFIQYLFFSQWYQLKEYANSNGVQIIGDLPFYVGPDSADVWSRPNLFKLDKLGVETAMAGVPPDRFSSTGQLWNNPVYEWSAHAEEGYDWWSKRLLHNFRMADVLRIDHFRGFSAVWEVPAGSTTADLGEWIPSPGNEIFNEIHRHILHPPVIAEDLGTITPDVTQLMERYHFPGMKVLQFAFDNGQGRNPYMLHNHIPNAVLYTGTHDNNTLHGWLTDEIGPEERDTLFRYVGEIREFPEFQQAFIRHAMMSVCNLVIFPMQDILGLGSGARMNTPGTRTGNWQWGLAYEHLNAAVADQLAEYTECYGRR